MGRSTYSGRGIVEHRANVSIRFLLDKKVLNAGSLEAHWAGGITETRGAWKDEIAQVKYTALIADAPGSFDGRMIFETEWDGKHYRNEHRIEKQPVNLGGSRYFFRCAICGRRVKAIYYGYSGWGCRHCCHLVYEASREHRNPFYLRDVAETSRKKAEYLRKTKHPRLANLMDAKAEAQEDASEMVLNEHSLRLFGRLP